METLRYHDQSQEFQELTSSEESLKALLEGSLFFTEPWDKEAAFKEWEKGRRFIADVINQDGSILDYGCANGFLLKSLQEWSSRKLDPYGLDIDKQSIEAAKKLFPSAENHFVATDEIVKDFPSSFDTVYWNVWDDYDFKEEYQEKLLKRLLEATNKGGRLILGFYNNKESNKKVIQRLEQLGYKFSGTRENPDGDEIVAWFDKP